MWELRLTLIQPRSSTLAVAIFLLLVLCTYIIWLYRRRKKGIEGQRSHAKNLGELLVLTASEFEHAIGSLLTSLGYRDVVVTGKAGDLMADITCQDAQGRLVVCQCKRYEPGNRVATPESKHLLECDTLIMEPLRG